MIHSLLIFFGAGAGGLCRYWISNSVYWCLGRNFPYGTLVVNVSGSFLMGFLFILILDRFDGVAPQLRSLLLIGFLGGYTTFSSFSIETLNLIENAAWLDALSNILLSVILCILFTWLGVICGRQL